MLSYPDTLPVPGNSRAASFLEAIRRRIPRFGLSYSAAPGASEPDETGASGMEGVTRNVALDLAAVSDRDLLGTAPYDASMTQSLRSGLLLRAEDFDASHAFCQAIPTPTGSYWHGILHRREPDFGNSRYWFDRVGEHPLFSELFAQVADLERRARSAPDRGRMASIFEEVLHRGRWDPFRFLDLCQACESGRRPETRSDLERIQDLEVHLLIGFSYRHAIGP